MKFHSYLTLVLLLWLTACTSIPTATIPPGPAPTATVPAAATQAAAPTPTRAAANSTPLPAATINPTAMPTSPPAKPAPTIVGPNMRAVDWVKVVTTDPGLTYDSTVPPLPGVGSAPWVKLKGSTSVEGYAMVGPDRILFLDISGDGQEEAVISLNSGGTAGNLGLLVYTVVNNAPILADSLGGYKFGGVADGALLKVIEPIYQGWEPNCCPSGHFMTRYQLKDNRLVQVSRDEEPLPEARKMTVDKFYELMQAKKYADAYNQFLSPGYHAASPYSPWVAGYANTISFTVTTSDNPDGTVKVDLISKDRRGSTTVTRHFVGYWKLTWISTARVKQWMLDKASFAEVD